MPLAQSNISLIARTIFTPIASNTTPLAQGNNTPIY
jgi:hypothetical protein